MAYLYRHNDEDYLFVHVYKTGGNSVREVLPTDGKEVGTVHCSFEDSVKYCPQPLKSFAVVRHPYTWVYSHYKYILRSKGHGYHTVVRNMDFIGFLNFNRDTLLRKPRTFLGNNHCTQTEMTKGVTETFKLEELAATQFKPLQDFIGIHTPVPKKNAYRYRPEDTMNWAEKQVIQRDYALDFETFGYER